MELAKLVSSEFRKHHFVLAKCPFCGGHPKVMETLPGQGLVSYFVKCAICGASSDFSPDASHVVQKWNKRA